MTTHAARFQSREAFYAGVADQRAAAFYRDPVITPGDHGRADVASGRMAKWMRFNDPSTLVWVTDPEGVMRALTRNQANLYDVVRTLSGKAMRVTMREVAAELRVAPSTVYRAAVKLQAMGFIAYQSNRGRLGGSMFILRTVKDGLDWARDAAKATVRKWWKASEERISRLRRNVASYFPGRERELYPYTEYVYGIDRNKYAEWSVDDFREAGLM